MSFMLLGILNAQAAGGAPIIPLIYSLRTLGGTGADEGNSLVIDSSGNVYALGSTSSAGAGGNELFLAKYNPTGVIEWQRTLGGTGAEFGMSVRLDSSEDVYVVGDTTSAGVGGRNFLIAKYNSSGVIQWQRVLAGADYQDCEMGVDSSDNVYLAGTTSSAGAGFVDVFIAKYNSSGTIQWQRTLGGSSYDYGFTIGVDSSSNIYIGGITYTGSKFALLFTKYNSSGTIQFQRTLTDTASIEIYGLAVDSSNNIYLSGFTTDGNQSPVLYKYNSSGTIQWQRMLSTGINSRHHGVVADSVGNVYVSGFYTSTYIFAKYNSSGTIQWQRTLTTANGGQFSNEISVDSSDNLYVLGSTSSAGEGSRDFLLAVIPSDGSLTGTYVLDGFDMVYSASTFTASTRSASSATSGLTSSTASLTAGTSTLTDASASLITHAVEIV